MSDYYPDDPISTESTEYDPSYYEPGVGSDSNLEQREAYEEEREYDIWRDEYGADDPVTEYVECGDGLGTFGDCLNMVRNPNRDPIVHVVYGDTRQTMPVYVVALIEACHLDRGESTNASAQARKLAKVIRSRGVYRNGRYIDQCGHIVGRKLGGLMRNGNLIPQGKTSNLNQFRHAEKIIAKHLQNQQLRNPRAVLQVGLTYGNNRYKMRPTKFIFSYVLFHDPDSQENLNVKPPQLTVNIRFKHSTGVVHSIAIRSDQVVSARTQVRHNNVKQFFSQLAFWSSIGAALCGLAVDIPVPAAEKVVSPPIRVPVAEKVVPPPIPVTEPIAAPPAPIFIPNVSTCEWRFIDVVLTSSPICA